MGEYQYAISRIDLEGKLQRSVNRTLGDCDTANVFRKAIANPKITGIAGDVVEQSIIGYPANSDQEPDLLVDGVEIELKTTGLRDSKHDSGLEAKEPMSITAVSLDSIVDETFETSKFWHKAKNMLIVYYLYDSDTTVKALDYANFPLKGYQFHEFTDDEKRMLKHDWELVRDFVADIHRRLPTEEERRAAYPRLSSELRSQLMLIDTAPKYPHPPRFRLKRSTVTSIARKVFGSRREQLPVSYYSYEAIDIGFRGSARGLVNRRVGEIAADMGIQKIGKNICEQIAVRAFGGSAKKMGDIELFGEIGLSAKSIVLTTDGCRTEDMKLFTIDFDEFYDDEMTFEDSLFYEYFSNHQLLCVVLEEPSTEAPLSENIFKGFKRLSFDEDFIQSKVRRVWERIRLLIRNDELKDIVAKDKDTGMPVINKTGVVRSAPNFPKAKEGDVFVRGTSKDSTLKPECVNGVRMYKQQIWVKGSYMAERLSSIPWV